MHERILGLAALSLLAACATSTTFPPDNSNPPTDTDAGSKPPTTKPDSGTSQNADTGTPPPPTQPTLEIISGNGGTCPSGWPTTDPLRVRVKDAQGNPLPNEVVTYAVGSGQSLHIQSFANDTATTDQDGIAAVTYNAFPIDQNKGYEEDTVTASWNGLSVDFRVIITQVPSGAWAAPPLIYMTSPDTSPDLGTQKAGSTVVGGLKGVAVFQQGPSYGKGVPGWGMRLTSSSDTLSPADVACAGGTPLSDPQGNMSCDLVLPKTPGDYYFSILAAGAIKWAGHVKVVP